MGIEIRLIKESSLINLEIIVLKTILLPGAVYHEGMNMNLYMVETGNAWWYKEYPKDNVVLKKSQESAIKEKRGLWSIENPISPWEFRKKNK